MRLAVLARFSLLWVVGFALLSGGSVAHAQPSALDMEARALFEAGRVAFVDERYEDALGYFERAHELSGRAELLYNIATCLDRLDRDDQALVQYEAYLAAVPDPENREEIVLRVDLLRARLARAEAARAEAARTEAARTEATRTEAARPEATSASAVAVPAATRASEHTSRPTEGRTIRMGEPVLDPVASGGGDVTSEAWFWVLMGAVVVGAGVGVTVGILATQGPNETTYIPGDGMVIMTLQGALP